MKKIIIIGVLITGILLLIYPFLARLINQANQSIAIEKYKRIFEEEAGKENIKDIENKEGKKTKEQEMIGFIEIDKINLKLPIYEGVQEKTLQKGIGHLERSGLPVDEKYECLILGHTGIASNVLFDNLIKLEKGDYFFVTILNKKYKYKIYDIEVVLPEKLENMLVDKVLEGKNVTLITCTPKYINSHRLLVKGREEKLLMQE